ncbi:hypothetical protein PVAND_015604 [Polypedilum vanderplanki]|uniref:Globin domain-containing protein n=1 Tax=Polypedilum vanderplanki TaxID=319348 RepID=A0A9J6BDL4_POLVA|nr:hypothetical protein PVAND_015604 [Polypedilum vanderplanki]
MKFLILALCVVAAIADPHWTELDSTEANLIMTAWNKVKTQESDILYAIFKTYPDIQNKFPQFTGKDLDSIKGSAAFAVHATRIVSFMTQVFGLFGHDGTEPAMKTLMNEMGQNHKGRGVTKAQFNEFRTAFMTYMKSHSPFGDNVQTAFNKAFDTMYYVIFENLDGHTVN